MDEDSEESVSYTDIYGNDLEKIKKVTIRLLKRFQKLTTTVHRQTQPCAAMADNGTDDNNDNIVDVSAVELDLNKKKLDQVSHTQTYPVT